MTTCLILWMPAGTTYGLPGPPLGRPGGLTEEDEDEVHAATRVAASPAEDMAARIAFRRRTTSTIWLPGERLSGPLHGLAQVIAARRPVQRATAVGQQLADQRDALDRDRAPSREALGQSGQLVGRPGDPVPAERDVRIERGPG